MEVAIRPRIDTTIDALSLDFRHLDLSPWEKRKNILRKNLSLLLEDIDHIDHLLSFYEITIQDILPDSVQKVFEKTIITEYLYYLGSKFFDHTS